MKAAALVARQRIRVIETRAPRPGPGEVLVRLRAVGVCRSDLHYYEHGRIGNQVIRRWPQVLGHEPAGEVAGWGRGVRGFRRGDRVAVEPAIPCGRCRECRAGRGNICANVRFLGMPGLPGAFAECVTMPAANLVKVGPRTRFADAAALEPMAIGLHAVGLVRGPLRRALVIGAGPVGLCVLAALRLRAARVTVCDYVPARLRVARRMGAAATIRISPRRSMPAQARRLRCEPAVFEAGGTAEAMELAVRAAAPGGTVAFIGIPDGDTVPYPAHVTRRKELTIVNVRRSNGELAEAARLLRAGRLNLGPMLTHEGGLDAAGRLFELVRRRAEGVVKATVRP